MSETKKRIFATLFMLAGAVIVGVCEYNGIHAVRYLGIAIVLMMIVEAVTAMMRAPRSEWVANGVAFVAFLGILLLSLVAVNAIGKKPWIILLLLMIICSADIGAWFFGKVFGGDKLWERISANKTWAGQIAGIICGTGASVLYGLLGTDTFLPQLLWIGISVSLLSQYGDLTASWIKRKIGIKDFGALIPGHGGVLDRFDGWIYALPIVWFVML